MPKLAKRQFFVVKCDLFDEGSLVLSKTARRLIAHSESSMIDSKSSVKEGMKVVRKSPFDTAFVIDTGKGRAIYALSQNIPFVNSARKKKRRPPLPPDPNTECCTLCMATGQGCFVNENLECICIDDITGTTLDDLGNEMP